VPLLHKAACFTANGFKRTTTGNKERLGEHDTQLNHIYDAMENLLDEKAAQRKWDERERIGFKNEKLKWTANVNISRLKVEKLCKSKPSLYSPLGGWGISRFFQLTTPR